VQCKNHEHSCLYAAFAYEFQKLPEAKLFSPYVLNMQTNLTSRNFLRHTHIFFWLEHKHFYIFSVFLRYPPVPKAFKSAFFQNMNVTFSGVHVVFCWVQAAFCLTSWTGRHRTVKCFSRQTSCKLLALAALDSARSGKDVERPGAALAFSKILTVLHKRS
jgi:hypothetical protein